MRHVGIREFKDRATTLLSSGETLVVERHGKPVGVFVPLIAKDRPARVATVERLGKTAAEMALETGMSEDELVAAFTWDEPKV